MNQNQFDEDADDHDGEYGYGWRNNPIRKLFDNPRQQSHRSCLDSSYWSPIDKSAWATKEEDELG